MSLVLAEVKQKNTLLKFIKFPFDLYKNCPYYVPPLIDFELSSLTPKNPAFEISKVKLLLALRKGVIVGRVAGIILDAEKGEISLQVSKETLEKRKTSWKERKTDFNSGTLWKYSKTVGSAANGAVTHPGADEESHVYADI